MIELLQNPAMAPVWILMLLLPWLPVLNLCRHSSFRRRLCLFPHALGTLVAGLLASILAAVALVVFLPQWVWPVAAVEALLAVFLFGWRARADYGQGRNLPPGKLTLAPAGPWVDYLSYRRNAERFGDIYKMSHFLQPMVCIVNLPLGSEFLARHDADIVTPPMPFNRLVPGGFMRYMAPELHRAYRARMMRVFSDPGILGAHAGYAAYQFQSGLNRLAEHGSPVNPHSFIEQATFAVLADLFFGLQAGTSSFRRLRAAYETIDYRKTLRTPVRRVKQALAEIESLVLAGPGDGTTLFSQFVALPESGPMIKADDPTLMRNFIYLLQTSWIDVADLLTWTFKFLADEPRWVHSLRRELAAVGPAAGAAIQRLEKSIILETLRLEQSEYLMRRTLRDIEFHGFRIPRNWLVRVCIRECHLDPQNFERPHDFNPGRFLQHSPSQREYSPFGLHGKSCVGVAITLWAGQLFVRQLATMGDWQVDTDGPRELGAFHWRPNRQFRVFASGSRR